MTDNLSIHPRNWPSMRDGEKLNTCEPRKKRANVERAIAGCERHLEEHPHNAMISARLSKLKSILDEGRLR